MNFLRRSSSCLYPFCSSFFFPLVFLFSTLLFGFFFQPLRKNTDVKGNTHADEKTEKESFLLRSLALVVIVLLFSTPPSLLFPSFFYSPFSSFFCLFSSSSSRFCQCSFPFLLICCCFVHVGSLFFVFLLFLPPTSLEIWSFFQRKTVSLVRGGISCEFYTHTHTQRERERERHTHTHTHTHTERERHTHTHTTHTPTRRNTHVIQLRTHAHTHPHTRTSRHTTHQVPSHTHTHTHALLFSFI